MSLRNAVLCSPNLSELNILDKALASTVNQRRDEILQYYIDNALEITFMIETKVGKRKTKVVGRATPKYIGKALVTAIGTFPNKIIGKKLSIPKVWITDMQAEVKETGADDDDENLPDNPESRAALEGVEWNA